MNEEKQRELPRYTQSFPKTVHAIKVRATTYGPDGDATLLPEDPTYDPIHVHTQFAKTWPLGQGYYVQYDDVTAFLPVAAFERLHEPDHDRVRLDADKDKKHAG